MNFMYLDISGMICAGCSSAIKAKLTQITGVGDASVDHIAGSAIVSYDPHLHEQHEVIAVIEKLGYPTKASKQFSSESMHSVEQPK